MQTNSRLTNGPADRCIFICQEPKVTRSSMESANKYCKQTKNAAISKNPAVKTFRLAPNPNRLFEINKREDFFLAKEQQRMQNLSTLYLSAKVDFKSIFTDRNHHLERRPRREMPKSADFYLQILLCRLSARPRAECDETDGLKNKRAKIGKFCTIFIAKKQLLTDDVFPFLLVTLSKEPS